MATVWPLERGEGVVLGAGLDDGDRARLVSVGVEAVVALVCHRDALVELCFCRKQYVRLVLL